jgi:hypothetical protein
MRIRTNLFVTLDGRVSDADGRPVQLLMPAFAGAVSYGLPEFLAETDAVVMGRTTFLPALGAPRWPWTQPVFVLTSTPLPKNTPSDVTTASTVAELVEAMRAAGIERDVHLVGGPSTTHAFRDAGALSTSCGCTSSRSCSAQGSRSHSARSARSPRLQHARFPTA